MRDGLRFAIYDSLCALSEVMHITLALENNIWAAGISAEASSSEAFALHLNVTSPRAGAAGL